MKISPPALIITVGTVMIISAFALFGKTKPENTVPVPIVPKGAPSGTIGYSYRGMFIGVTPAGTIPVEGFNSAWQWRVYANNDFSVAAVATGEAAEEASSLSAATAWIDSFKAK